MQLENFFTVQAKPTGESSHVLAQGQQRNQDFMSLILAQISQTKSALLLQNQSTTPTASLAASPDKNGTQEISLADLLAANPEIKQQVENFIHAAGLEGNTDLTQTLSLNQQAFDDTLKPLTNGIITSAEIQKGSPRILQALLIHPQNNNKESLQFFNDLKSKIQSLLKDNPAALLGTNLTPEQLTAIQNSPDGTWPEELSGVMVGLVILVPPQQHAPITIAKDTAVTETATSDTDETDQALQNILVLFAPPPPPPQQTTGAGLGMQKNNGIPTTPPSGEALSQQTPNALGPVITQPTRGDTVLGQDGGTFGPEDFETALKNFDLSHAKNGKTGNHAAGTVTPEAANTLKGTLTQTAGPGFNALQGLPLDGTGSLLTSGPLPGDILGAYAANVSSTGSLPAGTLTSLVTQAPSAGQPHPAAQLLALSIQKAAGQNENKTFILDMDPPELGRVEVRLSFGKDKTMKAHVIAEKPETYMMLERDSSTLQRIFDNMGMNSDGGLSFSLAEHMGQGFTHDQRGSSGDHSGRSNGTEDSAETINTLMTWQIDPQSGHTRYDILA